MSLILVGLSFNGTQIYKPSHLHATISYGASHWTSVSVGITVSNAPGLLVLRLFLQTVFPEFSKYMVFTFNPASY